MRRNPWELFNTLQWSGMKLFYPIPNFNGCADEVWKWISNFITVSYCGCVYLYILGFNLICLSKMGPCSKEFRSGELAAPRGEKRGESFVVGSLWCRPTHSFDTWRYWFSIHTVWLPLNPFWIEKLNVRNIYQYENALINGNRYHLLDERK